MNKIYVTSVFVTRSLTVAQSADVPQAIMDEHMGVVMSLFQRSDDNQKFLVTLNGYNNNLMKEKLGSEDDEERLEMEVTSADCKATRISSRTAVDNFANCSGTMRIRREEFIFFG